MYNDLLRKSLFLYISYHYHLSTIDTSNISLSMALDLYAVTVLNFLAPPYFEFHFFTIFHSRQNVFYLITAIIYILKICNMFHLHNTEELNVNQPT